MIDCSINIDDLIQNHPEDVRSTFGIGDNDNVIILAPDDGSGCIFTDNRVDDYVGDINVFILIGVGYVPSALYYTDENNDVITWNTFPINEDYRIYHTTIKDIYFCNKNTSLYIGTYRERFWVDVNICENGEDLGRITNGGRYVGYGDNITLSAIPYDIRNYTVTWIDITDPEHPVPLPFIPDSSRVNVEVPTDSRADSFRTLYNIISNRNIEVCFERIPREYTFRLFTNDGKISNLDLNQMADGYKLGDVSVSFTVNNTQITISTENSGYGIIKTYDFRSGNFGEIDNTQSLGHQFDRGIILYHVMDTQELTVSGIQYESDCCYVDCEETDTGCIDIRNNLCGTSINFTSFNGWVDIGSTTNNYNNLTSCNLVFPTFEWEETVQPDIYPDFIHEKETLPSSASCGDYYYISISNNDFYYRNMTDDEIYLSDGCYTYLDDNEWTQTFTTTFSEDVTLYAVFSPNTSTISLDINNKVYNKHTIGIIDYCFTYEYFEISETDIPGRFIPMGLSSLPLTVDENSYEYIRVGDTYYRKKPYFRETGSNPNQITTIKEIIGMKIYLRILGDTDNTLSWKITQNETLINQYFSGNSSCENIPPYECQELNFMMCGDIRFLAYKQ